MLFVLLVSLSIATFHSDKQLDLQASVPKQDTTCCNIVSMETPTQVGNILVQGLYLPGFIGQTHVMWLIETGAAHSILSFKIL